MVEREMMRQTPSIAGDDVPVGVLLDAWLQGKRHLSKRGYDTAQEAADRVRPVWGDTSARALSRAEIQAWISTLSVAVGYRSPRTRPASPSTRHKTLQALAGALAIGVDVGALAENPAAGVSAGRQTAVVQPHYLTHAEAWTLSDALAPWGRPMLWLLLTSGARIGEVRPLDVRDADAARGRLHLRQTKAGRPRDAPLTADVAAMLNLTRPRAAPLLTGARGERRVDLSTWRHALHAAADAADLLPLRPHDLRHTCASWLIAAGVDVKTLQAILGHKSAAMTLDRYGHLMDGGVAAATKTMGELASRYTSGTDADAAEGHRP